jgi:hypothetical protein
MTTVTDALGSHYSTKRTYKNPDRILHYLEQRVKQARRGKETCLFLPSILNLAKQLECSALDVHDSIRELVKKGYQFLMLSHDTPVTVCIDIP